MTTYSLQNLGLTYPEFSGGLSCMDTEYTHLVDPDNIDSVTFLGKRSDPSVPLPSSQDIRNAYNAFVERPLVPCVGTMRSTVSTSCGSYTFLTSENGSTSVHIPSGSISIASCLDPSTHENVSPVPDTQFMASIENLQVYSYNLVGQDPLRVNVGFSGTDWNNVFNFSTKDSTLTKVELMDVIGVMMSTIQNLNRRVKQLEASQPPV